MSGTSGDHLAAGLPEGANASGLEGLKTVEIISKIYSSVRRL
ncbi:hypothetical protein ACQ86N_42770 [Puia sp. P3]